MNSDALNVIFAVIGVIANVILFLVTLNSTEPSLPLAWMCAALWSLIALAHSVKIIMKWHS